jgi:O-methyltransferase
MLHKVKYAAKYALAPLIYRYPPSGIQPERLMYYLKAIIETASTPGPIVEVGSHLCGTSVIAYKMMRNLGINKPYICVDTFRGFVPDHFNSDASHGTPEKLRFLFADSSKRLVRRLLRMHKSESIQLLERDCTRIVPADFPDGISLCLLDVDLSDAVYKGLRCIWPLINPGGRILVDDCPPNATWRALDGLTAFCDEIGAPLLNPYGMGVIEKDLLGSPSIPSVTDALCDRWH